jgi:hypothetical protein
VKLTAGTDTVLSRKVFRWYTDCCRTPIANNATGPRFPVVALIHSFMDPGSESRSRNEMLGPLCRIYERTAIGPLPPTAPSRVSFEAFARRALKVLGWWLRGLARPNPFFDDRTGAPRSVPCVLTRSERAALY